MGAAAKKARYMVNRKSVRIFKRISESQIPAEIGKRVAKMRRRKYTGRLLTTPALTMKGCLGKVAVYLSLMRDSVDCFGRVWRKTPSLLSSLPASSAWRACTLELPHPQADADGREDARTYAAGNSRVPSPRPHPQAGAAAEDASTPRRACAEKDRMRGDFATRSAGLSVTYSCDANRLPLRTGASFADC